MCCTDIAVRQTVLPSAAIWSMLHIVRALQQIQVWSFLSPRFRLAKDKAYQINMCICGSVCYRGRGFSTEHISIS